MPHHRLLGSTGLASAGILLQCSRSCYGTGGKPVNPAGMTATWCETVSPKIGVEWLELVLQGIYIGPKGLQFSFS
jgi:hypothetical protein